jgi:uncharacterized membrane protein (DUF2068 family)
MTETSEPAVPIVPPVPKRPLAQTFIASLKIVKGVALAGVSLGIFRVAHRNLDDLATQLILFLKISPENHYARLLLEKAGLVQPGSMFRAGIVTSIYSSILLLEGLGLWFGALWAEYLVILSTGLFVPEEILSCIRDFSWGKFGLFAVNAVILGYFVQLVVRRHRRDRAVALARGPSVTA